MNEIQVDVKGGESVRLPSGITAGEALQRFIAGTQNPVVAARVDGNLVDLTHPLDHDCTVEAVGGSNEESLEILRHSTSHVMAQAVQSLYPEAKIAIGPAIENGFYYDFDCPRPISVEDLPRIEAKMAEIVREAMPIRRRDLNREEAIRLFSERGEPYKVELLEEIDSSRVSVYEQAGWVDLCRGPHLPSTGALKAFKLTGVAGAYWRGDERNAQLQRLYGTAFFSQKELDEYLRLIEEARKRDHRKLGRELDLFSISPDTVGGGLILWHPKGGLIRHLVEDYCKKRHLEGGYDFVYTPHIGRANLWETSGHLGFYAENMYAPIKIDEQLYYLKPMNCPFHVNIYKSSVRSYRDLPIRLAEWGTVYRFERSGVLHGLTPVSYTHLRAHET